MEVLLKFKKRYNGELSRPESNSNYWDMKLSTDLSPELLSSARSAKKTAQKAVNITEKKEIPQTSKYL